MSINRKDFRQRFDIRLAKVKAKTNAAFRFEDPNDPPVLVNSAFYHLFGIPKDDIPADYYDDPCTMTEFQEACYYEQITAIDDDFVPYLMPWFGTGVLASALGSHIEFSDREDPSVDPRHYPIRTEEDIHKLESANP
jgi:hypothetical protein